MNEPVDTENGHFVDRCNNFGTQVKVRDNAAALFEWAATKTSSLVAWKIARRPVPTGACQVGCRWGAFDVARRQRCPNSTCSPLRATTRCPWGSERSRWSAMNIMSTVWTCQNILMMGINFYNVSKSASTTIISVTQKLGWTRTGFYPLHDTTPTDPMFPY